MKVGTVLLLLILLPIASVLHAENAEGRSDTQVDPGFYHAIKQSARLIVTADGEWFIYWYPKGNTTLRINDFGYFLEWDLLHREGEYRAIPEPAGYFILNR